MRIGAVWILIGVLLLSASLVEAAVLKGAVYNVELNPETDVLMELNTTPIQRMLAREGTYQFHLSPGTYLLTAQKGLLITSEEVMIVTEGTYFFDLFLLPEFSDEDDLWKDTEEELVEEEPTFPWQYLVALLIIAWALWRYRKVRQRYGPLRLFHKRVREESKKTLEQHKEELAKEPGYLENALEIIKKHEGRITQKELRKEMLYLSEAKVSLIITELEHKGKIEKIKKGRGNVIIVKE